MANSVFIFPGGSGGGISPVNPSLFPNGSAAAPSISFINDPQSGRYLIGTDNIGESINGSLVFDWNATRFRTSLPIYLPNGAVGAPALSFENDATSGRYRIGNDNFGESVNGALVFDWNATRLLCAISIQISHTSGLSLTNNSGVISLGASSDITFARGAARILVLGPTTGVRLNWSTDGLLRVQNFAGSNQADLIAAQITANPDLGFLLEGRGLIVSPDNGIVRIAQANGLDFGRLILGTNDASGISIKKNTTEFQFKTGSDSAYVNIDALGYKASGVAGVSFGPAAVASITVVNGIVTAIS